MLFVASLLSQAHAFIAVLVFGLAVGAFGHVIRSSALILTGIVIVGGVCVYFSFVLQPA